MSARQRRDWIRIASLVAFIIRVNVFVPSGKLVVTVVALVFLRLLTCVTAHGVVTWRIWSPHGLIRRRWRIVGRRTGWGPLVRRTNLVAGLVWYVGERTRHRWHCGGPR